MTDYDKEYKLLEAEADFDAALDAAGAGYWHWDVSTDTLRWDARMHTIYGTTPDTFNNTYAEFDKLLVPEDRERVAAAVKYSIDNRTPFRHTFKLLNGSTVIGYGTARYNKYGTMAKLVGINMLIHELDRTAPPLCSQFCHFALGNAKV